MKKDTESLSHTVWKCKYHIVFAPKYRRQIIYGKYKASIGEIIRELCERRCRDFRSKCMPRPYTYVSQHSAKNQCISIFGVFKRKK